MNLLSGREEELSEQNCYISLLGNNSEYCPQGFESFLDYYSFKVDGERIVIFNTDPIPYESWDNNDFSSFPLFLLSFGDEKLESWIRTEIQLQLEKIEREKIAEKEDIKRQIELLTKKLNNYA